MSWQFSTIGAVLVVATAFAVAITALAWRRRAVPGARELALLMLAVAWWTLLRALEAAAVDDAPKIVWSKLEYVGIVSVAPLWLLFALAYTRRSDGGTLRRSLPLWIIPALTVGLAATNEHHRLIWTSIARNPAHPDLLVYGHGPWFFANVAYSYVLLAAGTLAIVLGIVRLAGSLRHQASVVLVAVALPWAGNAVYVAGWSPIAGLDLTPLVLITSGAIVAWAIRRLDLLDIVPVARETLVERLAYGVIVVDAKGRIVDANPAAARQLGLGRAGLIGAAATATFAAWPALLGRLGEPDGGTGELRVPGDPGRDLEFRIDPLRDRQTTTGSVISLRDVTARKQAEQALRQSEERYRDLVENVEELICTHDMDGRLLTVNRAFVEKTGYDRPDELLGRSLADLLAPDVREQFPAYLDTVRTVGRGAGLVQVMTRDGQRRIFEFENTTGYDNGGRRMVRAVARDVTDRRRAEREIRAFNVAALKEAETEQQKLAALVENSPDFIAVADLDGRMLYVNTAGRRLAGLADAGPGAGRALVDVVAPGARGLIEGTVLPAVRAGGAWEGETELARGDDGRATVVTLRAFGIREAGSGAPRFVAVVAQDITDRKRTETALREREEQLRQAVKMEAVGRLAGGIAHDFNNLLTVIFSEADGLAEALPRGGPGGEGVEAIRQIADRAAALTRKLLTFSRKQVLKPVILDLNETVLGIGRLLHRVIGEDIELRTELARDLGRVRADRDQIEQVLMNLAINARDAMPTGGRLVLATANAQLDASTRPGYPDAPPGPYVALVVSDTGTGMTPDVQEHLFEPFFTTKEFGKGTGLGLATVYGILRQHGAHVAVESAPGRGTTFRIYLPRVEDPAAGRGAAPLGAVLRGSETVLIVEDEAAVRGVVRRILEAAGYAVLEATNATEALRLVETEGRCVDLLLTDIVMPGISGHELAERLHRDRPDLPVLFMSGYDALARPGARDATSTLLEKPFTAPQLSRAVRAALDRGSRSRRPEPL